MKKLIILGLFVVMALVIAQTSTSHSRIHVIDRPLKVEGFINVQGNVYPVWTGKYDLGTSVYWWDSIYCEDGQYRYIMIWSADSTDTASLSPTKLTIDSIVAGYYGGMGGGSVDTFYFKQGVEWTASGWLASGDTIKVDTTSYASLAQVGDTAAALRNRFVVDTIAADSIATDHLVVNDNAVFGDTIQSNLIVEKIIASEEYYPRVNSPKPLITFIFDDCHETAITVAKPLFDAKSITGCVAVITGWIDGANRLTWANLKTLDNAGWEMLSHSINAEELDTCTVAFIDSALRTSKQILVDSGFTITGFAYPGSAHTDTTRRLTRKYYRASRGEVGLNRDVPYMHKLKSVFIDTPADSLSYKAYIDSAEIDSCWLIFSAHDLDSDDSTMMASLIDYAQGKNIGIVNFASALDSLGNYFDGGDDVAIGEYGLRANYVSGVSRISFDEEIQDNYNIYIQSDRYWKDDGDLKTDGGMISNAFRGIGDADLQFYQPGTKDIKFVWQPNKKGDILLRDGNHATGTINNDFFQIQDSSGTMQLGIANKYIRGTATFDATKTADTLVMAGVTATDYYFLQWKGATVPTSPLTYTAAAGSLMVFCAPADTSLARAQGYNWWRVQ